MDNEFIEKVQIIAIQQDYSTFIIYANKRTILSFFMLKV